MKAIVKATGEIVDLNLTLIDDYDFVDSKGVYYTIEQLELIREPIKPIKKKSDPDYWTRLEHQTAIAAMGGMCGNTKYNDYALVDMAIVQGYASLNRETMADIILKNTGLRAIDKFETIHNYVDIKNGIVRKGAVKSDTGEMLIIPINMRDGSLICMGKGNEDWLCSAPHGAGRLLSRSKAKELLAMEDFKAAMDGIYTTSVCESTIDEAPMVYKPMEEIIECIQPTVDIVNVIKPIYNFKAK